MSLTKEQVARRAKITFYAFPISFFLFFILIIIKISFRDTIKFPLPMLVIPIIFGAFFYLWYLGFKYPEAMREYMKRYNKASGGALSDTLEGMDTDVLREKLGGIGQNQSQTTSVKVRCAACKTLNDEAAKFCDECGQAL